MILPHFYLRYVFSVVYIKTTEPISLKLGGRMEREPRKNPLTYPGMFDLCL